MTVSDSPVKLTCKMIRSVGTFLWLLVAPAAACADIHRLKNLVPRASTLLNTIGCEISYKTKDCFILKVRNLIKGNMF